MKKMRKAKAMETIVTEEKGLKRKRRQNHQLKRCPRVNLSARWRTIVKC